MHQLTGYDIFNRLHTFRSSHQLTGKPLPSLNISKDMIRNFFKGYTESNKNMLGQTMSALVLIQVLLSEDRVNPEGQVQVNPPMVLTQPWEQPDTPSQHSCMSTNKGRLAVKFIDFY